MNKETQESIVNILRFASIGIEEAGADNDDLGDYIAVYNLLDEEHKKQVRFPDA